MDFGYGDIVKIKRKDEYGGTTDKLYRVVDKMLDGTRDMYLLQVVGGSSLCGWHSADRLIKEEKR